MEYKVSYYYLYVCDELKRSVKVSLIYCEVFKIDYNNLKYWNNINVILKITVTQILIL